MSNLPIVLSQEDTKELLRIGLMKEESLTLAQWELLGKLVGSILMTLRNDFIDHSDGVGAILNVTPYRPLYAVEELGADVPFFQYRM